MAIVPIDFTNIRQTNEANFLLVIEIEDFDCEPEFPISLLDLYSPCLPSVGSGIWLEQRGERVISDILVNCYSEEDMANLLEDTKNNSKESEKGNLILILYFLDCKTLRNSVTVTELSYEPFKRYVALSIG